MPMLNLGTLPYQDKSVSFWKNPHQFIEKNLEDNPRRVFLCRYLLITFDAKHIPLVNRTVFWPVISYIMWPRVHWVDSRSNFSFSYNGVTNALICKHFRTNTNFKNFSYLYFFYKNLIFQELSNLLPASFEH